ncbi:MAG: ornithine carbamoyltransferase [Desulfovibrio sp.]|uniref:ornithine carbamoyltransferase n=1 Tax=Desulfovibrio sp. TaxID=885 RepID=UPI00135E1CFE|nr:ornithine carbamoyltransferase [Desulfovibrio sp.]MTJ91640.1 ornithine carbamoyltransferase [Desulfovibrio sp.]
MSNKLYQRDFLKETDFTPEELTYLLDLAAQLKRAKKARREPKFLADKNIVILFEKDSTRTRCSFEVAAYDQGARITYLGPSGSQMGKKESLADTARVLARFYDGIEYRGFEQERVEALAKHANVPVWNGLTNEWHPTQFLADMLTMRECCNKPLCKQTLAYLGDARYNMGNSLMVGSALLGLDFRSVAPKALWTSDEVFETATRIAKTTGARITRTESVQEGVKDCDFLSTDVWVSMGEPDSVWKERIELLTPYRVDAATMEMTGNADCKFLHCLPSFHNRDTTVGENIYQRFGIECMEVSDDVFESPRNMAFEEAENRLHTIKAVMVATMAEEPLVLDA